MAGTTGSDQAIHSGRANHSDGWTALWAKVPPGQANFGGPAILVAEVAQHVVPGDEDDYDIPGQFIPHNTFDGIVGIAHSGRGEVGGNGVIGRGGANQGTGVVGFGGGWPGGAGNDGTGGIGVHGIGGSQPDFPWGGKEAAIPPGPGVIGQGGRHSDSDNAGRLPHAAGVIAIGGGRGRSRDELPNHTPTETGGIGVYAQGAEATVTMVKPTDAMGNSTEGPLVPSGPLFPGAGVLGRGGVSEPARGPAAAGVIGLAGGVLIPNITETGGNGVYGKGATGVQGRTEAGVGVYGVAGTGRGGMFQSGRAAQVQLVPQEMGAAFPNAINVTPKEIPGDRGGVQLPKDGRGGDLLALMDNQRQCTLWFCVRGESGGPAQWAQVLLGTSVTGSI